ncbi:flagellar biosynthetic protein FliO [Planomicrobium sp. Y74]|uniref:flagellar biosynthetic protein FliO n=1 Tax=Planomicrobium sp. Y74 TaxID=2478977 RepID=UPI002570ED7E|nr:flagellar biosynthetic protein FliO [Planomicrobium sp. Y74]
MIQKMSLYSIMMILLLTLSAVWIPSGAHAADPKVSDSYDTDQPAAEQQEQPAEAAAPEEKSFIVVIGQLIFYTLLIVFMIYGLIKFLSMKQKNLQPNQAVKLMGGTALGNNKSLQLVKVGGQIYLIGVGDQVTLIKEFTEDDEIHGIEKDVETQASPLLPKTVTSFIKEKVGGRWEKNPSQTKGFEQLFKQSLDKQRKKQDKLESDLSKQHSEDKEGRSL